jgi:uncharacterized protein
MWKLSQFTVVRTLEEQGLPEHALVFNTRTGRCMAVPSDAWARIVAHLASAERAPADVGAAVRRLAEQHYLVPLAADEAADFQAEFDRQRRAPAHIFPLLAVTSKCNIACTYCYEAGVQGVNMGDDVVDGVLRWFERRIVHDGIRGIHPGLFGGEPLMRPATLFRLMDGLNRLRSRYGTAVSYYCSSNGLLLTPALARQLAARGLAQIQISLDGPQRIHDERRVGHHGEGSYAKSLQAVRIAVDYVPQVTVKVNFDRHNRRFVPEVFDALVDAGLQDRVDVKLEAIAYQFADSGVAHDPSLPIPPESPELADAYNELSLEALQRGIEVSRDTAHTTPCMFSSEHGVLIGPEGEIYKCISLVGRKEFAVGSVFDDDYVTAEYEAQMDSYKRTADCYEERCPYIPVCAGGCAYESIIRTGRYDLRFCTKDYLAEFHFKRHLVRSRAGLERLGMRPPAAADFQGTAVAAAVVPAQVAAGRRQLSLTVVGGGSGGGGGCAGGCASGGHAAAAPARRPPVR